VCRWEVLGFIYNFYNQVHLIFIKKSLFAAGAGIPIAAFFLPPSARSMLLPHG
jgi:hypothetical protein